LFGKRITTSAVPAHALWEFVWQLPHNITALITGEEFLNKILTILFCW
jgi:hypothetical protein